jgi:hypothetical protein
MNPLTTGLLVVGGVAVAAWLLRRFSGDEGIDRGMLSGRVAEPAHAEAAAAEAESGPEEGDADESGDIAAITSDGWMFLPFAKGVELLAPANPEQVAEETATGAIARSRVGGMLSTGDLVAARVVRGAPGVDPWRLEALGRDREYLSWSFETEEAARTALELLERVVVRGPAETDDETAAVGAAEFEEARRVHEQTEQELAMMPDAEEPEEPK